MEITLNGEPKRVESGTKVAGLVETLELKGRRVAVMLNEEIVKRERWGEVALQEGDTVEVIHMVGGG